MGLGALAEPGAGMEERRHDVGKMTSFEEEALPYLDAVYRFAVRLTGSSEEAEDLVQDTFLRAFAAWDQYTPGTRAKSWLFTIARNLYLRQRDRGRRYEEIVAENTAGSSDSNASINPLWATISAADPEGEFFGSIVDGTVLRAIDRLPEEYRTAVVLSDVEGLAYDEIATLMDVPVGTVKSRLFRGRRRLQEALYDYAVETGHIRPKETRENDGQKGEA
jgi:RNA polymerase sigma-70 factor (ECF subfamily)